MKGLTMEEEQEYNRGKELSQYLEKNQAKVDGYVPLKNAQTALDGHLGDVEGLTPGKLTTTTSITKTKEQMKHDVADRYEFINTQCWAFCKVTPARSALLANFNYSATKIFKMEDGDVQPFAKGINELITNELLPLPAFADYGIDATFLSDSLAMADNFKGSIGFAGAISDSKTEAGSNVELKVEDLKADAELIDKLSVYFKKTDNGFFKGIQGALVINDIGVHHQYAEGEVKDGDGNGVGGAVITAVPEEGEAKVVKANIFGHYQTPKLKRANYTFTCEVAGKPKQQKLMALKHGILHIDWVV